MIEAKAFGISIPAYRSYRLSDDIKLTVHKAVIIRVRVISGRTYLLQLLRLQNKVLCTTGKFARRTPTLEFHMAFQVQYIYDYVTKMCRQEAEVIENHEIANVRDIGKTKTDTENSKRLKLDDGQAYNRSSD
jgi:hypothetical protein